MLATHTRRAGGPRVLHGSPPEQPRSAQLRDLDVEIHADAEEERQTTGEFVDVQATRQGGLHVFDTVREGEGELERRWRPGFLQVIAGDGHRVEAWHVPRRVGDDVRDDPHRGPGRVDVGVAHHEFLEDVVLDGARQPVLGDALLLGSDDVGGEHGEDGAVHRHRHRHFVEGDAGKEGLHVLHRIHGDAGLADVPRDPGVVGVITAMRGEVESHRDPLTAGGEGFPIERVGVLGR